MRSLSLSRIDEPQVRDNFKLLEEELKNNPVAQGEWKLFDREFMKVGSYRISHRLGFKPLDMIVTYNSATFTFDLPGATEDTIDLNVTVVGRVRFIIGRMK